MNDFIGQGWSFPPKPDGRGVMALASGEEKIRQSIEIILGTPIGQRVMRPTFGSRLHELVFAPLNAETMGLAELFVEEALAFWEPRIEVLEVNAEVGYGAPEYRARGMKIETEQDQILYLDIRYRIKQTYDERSLLYPFYQIRGE